MATATRNRQSNGVDGRPKNVRLSKEVEQALTRAAERNYRSVSAEIRARLDRSLEADGYLEEV